MLPRLRLSPWLALSFALACMAGTTQTALAQSDSGAAAISGTVVDPDGRPIPGATVTIAQGDTGYTRSLVADADGRFQANALPVGTYVVQARSGGFSELRQEGVSLRIGETATLTLQLRVGTVSEQVTVTAAPTRSRNSATGMMTGRPSLLILPASMTDCSHS